VQGDGQTGFFIQPGQELFQRLTVGIVDPGVCAPGEFAVRVALEGGGQVDGRSRRSGGKVNAVGVYSLEPPVLILMELPFLRIPGGFWEQPGDALHEDIEAVGMVAFTGKMGSHSAGAVYFLECGVKTGNIFGGLGPRVGIPKSGTVPDVAQTGITESVGQRIRLS
jgi:hypothetical protein